MSPGSPTRCPGRPGAAHESPRLPAIPAITHAEGKAIRSSRRARRGAGCYLRGSWRLRRAPISRQPRLRGGRRRRSVILSQGAHARMGVPVGEGSAGPRAGHQETFERRRRFALAFARACGRRHGPGRRARVSSAAQATRGALRADPTGTRDCTPEVTGPPSGLGTCRSRFQREAAAVIRARLRGEGSSARESSGDRNR